MKKRIMFLTAVLLFAVLLFFWKKGGFEFPGQQAATATPTPVETGPETFKNVWIVDSSENSITFFFEGDTQIRKTKGTVQDSLAKTVADVTIEQGEITSLVLKPDKVTAKVLRADAESIELEGYGELLFSEDWKLYRLYDGLAVEPSEKLLVGSAGNEFILENGRVCAALLKEAPNMETIRVLIGTEGFTGVYHGEVQVTADVAFTVSDGEKEERYDAGEECTFTKANFAENTGRITIVPEDADGKVTLLSIKRSGGTPSYRGSLEVNCREEGLLVVNELTVEEYLYAVLPSEMPSDFEEEALKAQAICARSYAYRELLANRYAEYGAHVDDSVSCQVYNNIPESSASILAVKDTHGQVLLHDGEVAQCYYFSTSSGHTTSAADVWENATEESYLPGKLHLVTEPGETSEVRQVKAEEADEAYMTAFLTEEGEKTYDSESQWYRWETFLSLEALEETMLTSLQARYQAVPEQILTYDVDSGEFVSEPVTALGELQRVQVYERGVGGIATKLLIVGTKGVFLVKNEYNIRTMLAPLDTLLYRKNGETVNGASLLPSAFITLQKGIYGEETGYLVQGGGYGHGVGMSQCGADAMAGYGYTCEDIIEEYYPGTTIGFIYGGA
ncbi:MAG: SpoIID/LytB domain-containing protein [Lachnospiraceae bacterium]|nr:SpoIID/LytB domain-containing protein [Lachnospiraceae bacterium]